MATRSRSGAETPSASEPMPTLSQPAQIGDVNASLVAPVEAPTLPEVVSGPPQLHPKPVGPHYIRVLSEVTIKGGPYDGFKFQMVKNFKMGLWDNVTRAPNFETQCHTLAQIVLQHYDWCDDEGNPLPPIQDDPVAFVNSLPMDLYGVLIQAVLEEAQRVPDFPTPTLRR